MIQPSERWLPTTLPQSQSVGWHLPQRCTLNVVWPPVQWPLVSQRTTSPQLASETSARVMADVLASMLCHEPCSAGVTHRAPAGEATADAATVTVPASPTHINRTRASRRRMDGTLMVATSRGMRVL